MENQEREMEREVLTTLIELEDLVEKKTKIHARLLMDAALAKDMEELSLRHQKRKETLSTLLTGKAAKKKNGQGMSLMKEEGEDE